MAEGVDITTESEIDAAFERARTFDPGPLVTSVQHDRRLNVLVMLFQTGRRLVLPVEELQGLEHATPEQLAHVEIVGIGRAISFPDLDVDLFVPSLLKGIYGTERWMQHLQASNIQAAA